MDEVFINLPSEEYDIGEFISRFETMGIDVTVNLNAFDHNLGRDKKIRGMAGLNVITFSTKFYKNSHVIAKRVIDIIGSIFGLMICGLVSIVLVPDIRKDGGPAIFAQTRIGKTADILRFINLDQCVLMLRIKRENCWRKILCRVVCLRWTMILALQKLVALSVKLAWMNFLSFGMF